MTLVVFIILIECNVRKSFIRDELFFLGIFSRQIEISVPGTGIEVDLIAANIVVIERNGLVMMCMSIDNIARSVI